MSEKNLLEVVRIKDGRTERNATRAEAKRIGAKVLEGEPVRDQYGRPVPAKPTPGKPRTDLVGQPVITETSTVADIDAYAASNDIDLTGATTKADKIAAIAAAEKKES